MNKEKKLRSYGIYPIPSDEDTLRHYLIGIIQYTALKDKKYIIGNRKHLSIIGTIGEIKNDISK